MARATPNGDIKQCITDCLDCYKSCIETAMTHCLQVGGAHTEPAHFRLMINCADICRTAADFMLSESAYNDRIRALCADICEACAESCRDVGGMDDCVLACEQCAASCDAIAASGKPLQRESLLTHPKSLLP